MVPFLAIFAAVAVIGGISYAVWYFDKKRTDAMRAVAQTMGWTFHEEAERDPETRFGALPLFERGHSRKAKRIMTGELAGAPAVVMDYQFTIGSGKSQQTHAQTVAIFPTHGAALPDFELAPENLFHKLGQVFGYQDIDFDQFPEFSKRYLLRGEDESAVRTAFNQTVLAFLEQNAGWTVQSRGQPVCVFRAMNRSKPEEVPAFLADALRIASALGGKA